LCEGTLNPDVTGTYKSFGFYVGKPLFKLVGGDWYCSRYTSESWLISLSPGTEGAAWWYVVSDTPAGVYTPGGTATGALTMSLIV